MAIRAVEAGKDVLVEKPLGVDVAECERSRDVVRARSGVHVQVGERENALPALAETLFRGEDASASHAGRAAVSRVPPREATLPRGQRGSQWRQRGLAMRSPSHQLGVTPPASDGSHWRNL